MTMQESLKTELQSFSDNWSGHGVHRIAISANIVKKAFYAVVFIGSFGLFVYQVRNIYLKYVSYPVNTVIEIHYGALRFPAITICNNNIVRKSKVRVGGKDFENLINKSEIIFDKGLDFNFYEFTTENETVNGTEDFSQFHNAGNGAEGDSSSNDYNSYDDDYESPDAYYDNNDAGYYSDYEGKELMDQLETSREDVFHEPEGAEWLTEDQETGQSALGLQVSKALMKVNISDRLKMGHQLNDMLQSCSFNGRTCSAEQFRSFYNVQYGNCYTFNGMASKKLHQSFRTGPQFGLNLEFVVEQDEYIGSLTQTAGMRLTVHDPYDFPFPEDDGIDLSPGKLTSVGLRLRKIEKLGHPYNTCTYGRRMKMAYKGRYTVEACLKTCLQGMIVSSCNCSDTRYSSSNLFTVEPCHNDTEFDCITETQKLFNEDEDACYCPASCKMNFYEFTVSTADYPSSASRSELVQKFKKRSSRLSEIFNGTEERHVHDNLLKVQIFFETLQYEQITEQPAYAFENMLADVGGQAGLLIGWSVISFCEIAEFLSNLVWILVKSLFVRKTSSVKAIHIAPEK